MALLVWCTDGYEIIAIHQRDASSANGLGFNRARELTIERSQALQQFRIAFARRRSVPLAVLERRRASPSDKISLAMHRAARRCDFVDIGSFSVLSENATIK